VRLKVVIAHPTGNSFVRAALPDRIQSQLLRRGFPVPPDLVRAHPALELSRLAMARLVGRGRRLPRWASVDAVYRDFDRYVGHQIATLSPAATVGAVYCYEDAAAQTFSAAKRRGIACMYELPIAYWEITQRLLREESERWPAWRQTLGGLEDSSAKLEQKARELAAADAVIVPSRFVMESLPAEVRQAKPCFIAPFGGPPPASLPQSRPERSPAGPLRVLFAGALSQRKGLADLFAAMRRLDRRDVELVVMGTLLAPMAFYRQQYQDFTYEPPRPHEEVLALMKTCDVLALPSIVEGQALVQHEALSSGLSLLVTPHSGADDLLVEGQTGFQVPIRNPDAIAERLMWLAQHREAVVQLRQAALAAAADYGWSRYEQLLNSALTSTLAKKAPARPLEAAC
jgi:glycosyltransferase involved in cell wall biosynthesis